MYTNFLKIHVKNFCAKHFYVQIFLWVWQTTKIEHAKIFECQKLNTQKISNVYA